ncbi:CDP-alcohol phosphatidyltransferase domain-containing protein [Ditylenchus destructor]|uniref:CDP-alcohol phosphatidyltransferase domain-containing protein n=1 Tax=Ditylenchus destructor TaxID=166010 RepID=A0AAD4NCK1_9BILA|nr:CDP-alcohol phosphatidyltransferase domain-containing protein [Ditylenchus destructor]
MPVRTRSQRNLTQPWGTERRRENSCMRIVSSTFEGITNVWESYFEGDCQLRPAQLTRLGDHKYLAIDSSWLDELCMKKFWNAIVEFYPLWLAPNLITLVGLVINVITVLILSHFCFSATEVAPAWAYLQAALGLFIYQTLDATDGKQARRTNSASPLGELFDHGCDSFSQGK